MVALNHIVVNIAFVQALFLFSQADENTECLAKNGNAVCLTPGCVKSAALVLHYLDQSVNPCEDFYKFACGGFIKTTTIPDDLAAINQFRLISGRVVRELRHLMEEPSQPDELTPFTLAKLYYNSCMNISAVENDNLQTAKSILKSLGGWSLIDGSEWNEQEFDWKEVMYNLRKKGLLTSSLMTISVFADLKNNSRRIIYCDEPTLRINRIYLLDGLENKVVAAHYKFLVEIAVKFGANRTKAKQEIEEVVEFECDLAQITLPATKRRNLTALYTEVTVEELQHRYPDIPWQNFLTNVLLIPDAKIELTDVINIIPEFLTALEDLLQETPKRVLANYIMLYTASSITTYLNKEIRDLQLQMSRATSGNIDTTPRWKQCLSATTDKMKIAVTAMYVRKYFNTATASKVKNLVDDLLSVFLKMVQDVEWMDQNTKQKALEKVSKMASNVGHPSEFLDDKKLEEYYSSLKLEGDNYLQLALEINKFKRNLQNKQLREPVNKSSWIEHSAALQANAFYNQLDLVLEIPAAILQGVFFDADKPHYMNYGSIGFIIGHEITHGFDDKGRLFNSVGNLKNWWEEQTAKSYLNKIQCIVDQYSNYTDPVTGLQLNAKLSQGENIADYGGAKEAYLAYEAWVERHGEEPYLPGLNYTPRQLFWISLANSWCVKWSKEFLSQMILTGEHFPANLRINGIVRNSKEFSKDFACPLGAKMNPEHKCQVW